MGDRAESVRFSFDEDSRLRVGHEGKRKVVLQTPQDQRSPLVAELEDEERRGGIQDDLIQIDGPSMGDQTAALKRKTPDVTSTSMNEESPTNRGARDATKTGLPRSISRYSAQVRRQRLSMGRRWQRLCASVAETTFYQCILGFFGNSPLPPSCHGRNIEINAVRQEPLIDERRDGPFIDNTVTSSRYTPYSFLPKQLYAQFSKIANFYFLIVSIMQMIPGWSTTGNYTTIVPLLVFLSLAIGREGYDDWCRSRADKAENNKGTNVVCYNGTLQKVLSFWKDLRVGDIVCLKADSWVPADLLLLSSEGTNGVSYVESAALDGETNLKSKFAHPDVQARCKDLTSLESFRAKAVIEDPNPDLYNFNGALHLPNGLVVPLTTSQILLRGCIVRNTKSLIGVVVFSGEESKIRMNANKNIRTKAPHLQRIVNKVVLLIVVFVVCLAIFCTAAYWIWKDRVENKSWYLQNAGVAFVPIAASFIILYNTLIPLSLYVAMEIVKIAQMVLMQWDVDMYDPSTNTPMEARTCTINEELGQVTHIFTDKTGTLTDNIMLFRKLSVGGQAWLHDLDVRWEANEEKSSAKLYLRHKKRKPGRIKPDHLWGNGAVLRSSTGSALPRKSSNTWTASAAPDKPQPTYSTLDLIHYLRTSPHTLYSRRARTFIVGLGLCHTCMPDKDEDGKMIYQSASPDELALVTAAMDLGFMLVDRDQTSITIQTQPDGPNGPSRFQTYSVLETIEFSTKRKRMSILIRMPDGRITLFCKGADSVIIERLRLREIAQMRLKKVQRRREMQKAVVGERVKACRGASMEMNQHALPRQSLSMSRSSAPKELDQWLRMRTSNCFYAEPLIDKRVSARHDARHSMAYGEPCSPLDQDVHAVSINERLLDNEALLLESTFHHLEEFATEGLRTLLYGWRDMSEKEYVEWQAEYTKANSSLVDRQTKIEEAAEKIEHHLELSGATAIEDKLQKGVPETIDKLRRANIKLWMLTGDKRETAINIGYSCRLIKNFSTVFILDHEKDDVAHDMGEFLQKMEGNQVAHSVIVVDGATLGVISSDEVLMAIFVDIGVLVDSVICCRASPSQKSLLVKMVRTRVEKTVTLAIGDGANDIAMIQEAHVGIGITGREGLQAARSSDYSIAQFRFLLKLILVHGRWNYIRLCKYCLCTFYKEVFFYLGQAIFQIYTGWTGTSMYENWSISMFNTLFTSLPVLVIGIFEKDLSAATLLAVPELYVKGQKNGAFNIRIYLGWMFLAITQSFLVFFLVWVNYGNATLYAPELFPIGMLVYSIVVVTISIKVQMIEMHSKSYPVLVGSLLSIGGW